MVRFMRRSWRRTNRLARWLLLFVVTQQQTSLAQVQPTSPSTQLEKYDWPRPTPPSRTIWVGAQIVGTDWSVYTGTTVVLFGDDIRQSGWRLRTTGGYGRYRYHADRTTGTTTQSTHFKGHQGLRDILVGYQYQLDRLTIKAFAGVAISGHLTTPHDPENMAIGTAVGATGALEVWFNISEATWLSMNGSYATQFESFASTASIGHEIIPDFSLGLELGIAGNHDYALARAAAFGRYTWSASEVRVSAGIAANRDHDTSPYASVNFVFHY